MRFEGLLGRRERGEITQAEAAEMLGVSVRTFQRWAERQGFGVTIDDVSLGEEAGITSATFTVRGRYAYGMLTGERGVHRLVRISPFDSAARRHTSFASLYVWPELPDDVEIDIPEKDLRIDTFRSSGAGGQHVNVTDSAIRITHLPTGLVVIQQDQRSQHKNRAKAMQVLRARLYEAMREEAHGAEAEARKAMVGSGDRSERIRTYNFPQGRVTDHRINLTLYKLDQIMEGPALEEMVQALMTTRQAELLAEADNAA